METARTAAPTEGLSGRLLQRLLGLFQLLLLSGDLVLALLDFRLEAFHFLGSHFSLLEFSMRLPGQIRRWWACTRNARRLLPNREWV